MSKNNTPLTIVWFRQDLRVQDNPALCEAAENGRILPIYILDDENAGNFKMGAASRVWLYKSLKDLNKSLNGHLQLFKGDAKAILDKLAKETKATGLYWNRCYEPWRVKRDKQIKAANWFKDIQSFNGSLLWEPWDITKTDGSPYKVFTPFFKKSCLGAAPPRKIISRPTRIDYGDDVDFALELEELDLLPEIDWHSKMLEHWDVSENGAHERLSSFLDNGLKGYKEGRNFPSENYVSRLSPYLHHGQVSPNQVWYAAQHKGETLGCDKDLYHFHSELGWREFSYNLLYNFPDLPETPLQEQFKDFPWREDKDILEKWKRGQTGFPIVDAAMRELWETGYMHNRSRMIVGSFLVKNMLLHWHEGEAWFWDCLFDADLANNSASWQWIAGCGADAAPYFRIFNPMLQGEKFDEKGEYIRKWVPGLKNLPDKHLNQPWDAPDDVLKEAGITLGEDYPRPDIGHKEARERALEAYETIKKKST